MDFHFLPAGNLSFHRGFQPFCCIAGNGPIRGKLLGCTLPEHAVFCKALFYIVRIVLRQENILHKFDIRISGKKRNMFDPTRQGLYRKGVCHLASGLSGFAQKHRLRHLRDFQKGTGRFVRLLFNILVSGHFSGKRFLGVMEQRKGRHHAHKKCHGHANKKPFLFHPNLPAFPNIDFAKGCQKISNIL